MSPRYDLAAVPVTVEADPDGGFTAYNDDVRGLAAGDTAAEAEANFRAALAELVNYCLEHDIPLSPQLAAVEIVD